MTETPPTPPTSYPSRRSLRLQADHTPDSLVAPERVEIPVVLRRPQEPVAPKTPATPQRSPRRVAAALTAAASVCGLAVASALPFANVQSEDAAAAAATQQRLFSEVAGTLPATLAEVAAVDTDTSGPRDYAFRATALVNYPFTGSVLLTDTFGYRTAPVEQFHDAQDFAAAEGTPIQIIADGKVTEAGSATDGCGFALTVAHRIDGHDVTSRYCHMQDGSHTHSVGDNVSMGDDAGRVGATGIAFGAHLHLAIRVDEEPVDPMPFLEKYYRVDRNKAADSTSPMEQR